MGEEMRAVQELLKEEMLAKLDAHHEKLMPGIRKGQIFRKRRAKLEGINGIGKQLHLRKERTSSRSFRETLGLEVAKRITWCSFRI
jgi:hypothetical protein